MATYTIQYNVTGINWYDANLTEDGDYVSDFIEYYPTYVGPVIGPYSFTATGYASWDLVHPPVDPYTLGTAYEYSEGIGADSPITSGIAVGTVSGGAFNVGSGGETSGVTVENGGLLQVDGGYDLDATINALGSETLGVASDATSSIASGTTINSGGTQKVNYLGVADAATVNNGGSQYVSDEATVDNTIINGGGIQYVQGGNGLSGSQSLSGGVAIDTFISSGGYQEIDSGGTATGTTIENGGEQVVVYGGSDTSTTINDGGQQYVYGGMDTSATISSGGQQFVEASGTEPGSALFATIASGGEQEIFSGGVTVSTTINDGGAYNYSGSTTDTTINSGGFELDYSGTTATAATVNSGGIEFVLSGGDAEGASISSGGTLGLQGGAEGSWTINSGGILAIATGYNLSNYTVSDTVLEVRSDGTASGATIQDDGVEYVQNGGMDIGASINSGGSQYLESSQLIAFSGGNEIFSPATGPETTSNTEINDGGFQYVSSGGIANNTTINSGGDQTVYSGGSATSTIISGGSQTVESGGTATSTTVESGGYQYVSGTATDTLVNSGGAEVVATGGDASGVTVDGGTVELGSGVKAFSADAFSGTLDLPNGGSFFVDAPDGLDIGYQSSVGETSDLELGVAGSTSGVVSIDDATVTYSDSGLTISGTVYAALGDVEAPLFQGEFTLPFDGPTTTSLTDDGAIDGKFDLGGLALTFQQLSLEQNSLLAGFAVTLPFTTGSLTLNTALLGINYALSFGASGPQFVGGGMAPLPNLGPINVFGIFTGSLTNASLSYIPATDAASDILELQGTFVATQILRSSLAATVNFSGDNFIQFQNGSPDFVGNLSITGFGAQSNPAKAAFGIKEIDLSVNTIAQTCSGGVVFSLPFGVSAPEANVTVKASWADGPVITEVDVSCTNIGIVVPDTPDLIWQDASLAVANMFTDSAPTTFSGSLGFSFGPTILGQNIGTLTLSGSASSQQLTGTEEIQIVPYSLVNGLVGGSLSSLQSIFPFFSSSGTVTANFNASGLGFQNFSFAGVTQILGNFITINQNFMADSNLDFAIAGSATVNFGDSIFSKIMNVGVQANAAYLVSYTNGGPLSADYAEAWTTAAANFLGFTANFVIGAKATFDGNVSTLFGAPTATATSSDIAAATHSFTAFGSAATEDASNATPSYLFITTSWENAATQPVDLTITNPGGTVISEADFAANNIAVISALSTAYSETVAVLDPSTTTGWSAQVVDPSGLGAVTVTTAVPDAGPSIQNVAIANMTSPTSVAVDYTVGNTEGDTTLSFYADQDGKNFDGVLLSSTTSVTDGAGTTSVNVGSLSDGVWHVYGLVSDGTAIPGEVYASETVTVAENADGNGSVISIACYCRGTLIETEHGPVAVEALVIGDRLKTLGGDAKPIKWIGTRSYDGRFVANNREVLPICIAAGALGENVPSRDLWISPHHALYLEGALIESKDLVNGISIVQAEKIERVDYFHVELFNHNVIFAEGAEAETFIDNDSRAIFQNVADYFALYPEAVSKRLTPSFAPRRDEGFEIELARKIIAARAGIVSTSAPGELRGWVEGLSSDTLWGWAQDFRRSAKSGLPACPCKWLRHWPRAGQPLPRRSQGSRTWLRPPRLPVPGAEGRRFLDFADRIAPRLRQRDASLPGAMRRMR